MAPVCKYLKAWLLGIIFRMKCRRTWKLRGKRSKGRQVHSVGSDKHPTDGSGGEIELGTVFWGQLPDGAEIAVKRLDPNRMSPVKQFSTEARALGTIQHKNLLSLRGYCAEGKERLIVYDYMPNLSLHTHLHGKLSSSLILDWPKRMAIAIGAAEGLSYLHHSAKIIHGNIKANNILIDANYDARVTDFGLAKLMNNACTPERGSTGYLAPEYLKGGAISQSGDVYGFGILLLELISGRKPIQQTSSEKTCSIWEWAEPLIAAGRYAELIDPKLKGKYLQDGLNLVVYVATMCAQSVPGSRITMLEALDLLRLGSGSTTNGPGHGHTGGYNEGGNHTNGGGHCWGHTRGHCGSCHGGSCRSSSGEFVLEVSSPWMK